MPFTPEQKLWLNQHLVESGRSRGEGTEEERARREDKLVTEVTERIELSANATYLSEEVVKIIEDGDKLPGVPVVAPVKTDPSYPLLALHDVKPPQPVAGPKGKKDPAFITANKLYNDWCAQNSKFETAQQEYDRDDKARRRLLVAAPVKAAAQSRVNDLKTQQPDQYNSLKMEAVRKEEAKTRTAFTGDKDALTDKHLTQIYIIDEIDREISDRIAVHDQKVAASGNPEDPETRLEEIAEIIEDVGGKYEFTNLAHFISRHGAERVNPVTGEAKRTKSDAVARIATGVGPDQVPKSGSKPTTDVTGKVGGDDVNIPEYTHVGEQTAPASSQHASAKAALFMLEEGAAQTSMEEHLAGSDRTNAVNVTVGHETIGEDDFVSYPETGGLGDAYQLKSGSTEVPLGKTGAPDSGDALPKSKVQALLADIEQTHDQQSAILTNLPDQVLGGHTPITMFSKDATDASTTYKIKTPTGTIEQTLDKAAATIAKQEKDAITAKSTAEKTLATVMDGDTSAKQKQVDAQKEQDIAKAAVDLAIKPPVDASQQLVIDDVTMKTQDAVKARIKATASASLALKSAAMLAEIDSEVKGAQKMLADAEATASQANSSGGTAKTTEEKEKDAMAVQNVKAWVARAVERQTQADRIAKEATATKLAEEKTATDLEALCDAAIKKPGPMPKESLEKVAEHAKASVKADAAKEEAAMWSLATVSAQAKAEKANEVVTGLTRQIKAREVKIAEDEKLDAAIAEETHAKQEEIDAKLKQDNAKAAVDLEITPPINPSQKSVIDEVASKAKELAEAEIEVERYKAIKNPSSAQKDDRTAAFKLMAKLKGELAQAVKTAGPVPKASLEKVAAHAQASVKANAATVAAVEKSTAVVDAQAKVTEAEAKVREVTDVDAILAAELAAERLASETKAKDLAKGGGDAARKNLSAYAAEELKAIDESEARIDKDAKALAVKARSGPQAKAEADLKRYQKEFEIARAALTKATQALAAVEGESGKIAATKEVDENTRVFEIATKRLETANRDAAAVEKTLKVETAARANIQAKAIKRARTEVKNRVAAALASAPDATPEEIKEATKAKAAYEYAEAEASLAETKQTVDRARDRLTKATVARDKAVAAMKGKTLNTSQTEFLANVKRRAADAQTIVDKLEKVDGPLKLAEQKVTATKHALDSALSS